jgi:hypothetical protein
MDNIKKKFQIVVARYNEDITWLLPLKDIVIIYNKGDYNSTLNNFNTINIKNYGRESHTYLYHIINHYENLSEKIIFFQGKINDHDILEIEDYFGKNNFIAKLKELNIDILKKKIEHYGKWKKQFKNGNMKMSLYTPYDWLTKIIGIEIDSKSNISKVVWGANFSLSKELILTKPKIFYENILRYIDYHINPEEGHFLERSWYLIFNNNYVCKNKIGYIYLNIYFNDMFNRLKDYILKMKEYEEIHIWMPIIPNNEFGINNKINYTPENNKYLIIKPEIKNNIESSVFNLNIKSKNDAHILIEFNIKNIYEIVLGGWNNSKSIIRDYVNNYIINVYENETLDKNNYINFNFVISDKIKIYKNDNLIFDIENIFKLTNIKTIKIKSSFNSDAYWDYKNSFENYEKIKFHMCNSSYDNINIFYQNNYLDNYIDKIDILNFYNI